MHNILCLAQYHIIGYILLVITMFSLLDISNRKISYQSTNSNNTSSTNNHKITQLTKSYTMLLHSIYTANALDKNITPLTDNFIFNDHKHKKTSQEFFINLSTTSYKIKTTNTVLNTITLYTHLDYNYNIIPQETANVNTTNNNSISLNFLSTNSQLDINDNKFFEEKSEKSEKILNNEYNEEEFFGNLEENQIEIISSQINNITISCIGHKNDIIIT
ncbi:hypothetical protein NLO413_0742 [Candidatus Neoehrlichia lotoris str. RAC413]|uniref:Uncharacterized protein n=2 Tax=Candidatus Neoehrlichia procyonis TaxID=467750 RepID=A0A0F3NMR2_9RICK|nr:hypothetical protein NLO413_0742 [Candidatus Neoehrlichia lotoris str. RAC413]